MGQDGMSSGTNDYDYRSYRGEAYYELHRAGVKENKREHSAIDVGVGLILVLATLVRWASSC
ncbi:hypothetical protein [Winkia neuii]|uniref:Uncharacterized protein n=1 Tax=Winkia neuii TaxID=33007 RepID=A0A2I1ILF0_9ACTO|nr:hypothetical protein [Winkia neuii]MDK8100696.1 hypothetical protein [Winkia neuii]PKY71946.1 hypothetical protein CYJ19_09565 [Winkia neuii]